MKQEPSTESINPFADDEANIAIRHLYGELVWLKVYDFPFWPAIVLHPQWLSESLTVNLKLNKKKTQNRLVAQFFDDVNSSQVVGLKNICYPFEDYYNDYKSNKAINASFIKRAKKESELTRLQRCQARYPTMTESDLLRPDYCIVCNKPIDDLDPADIRINRGAPGVQQNETHFQQKSYFRCTNPQCLSVYHKQCVPNCVWNGRCGVCKPETTSERRRSISSAPVESESKPPPKRHESRRDENEESKGLKRLPFRSTRTAVPREMIDDESSKPSPKKRRVQSKQKTESQGKIGASKGSELVFDRINGEKAMQLLNQLLKDLYEDGMKEEVPILVNIKNCLRSVIAWFSTFSESERCIICEFVMLLKNHNVSAVREFADRLHSLLEKKLHRHFGEVTFESLVRREVRDGKRDEKRMAKVEALKTVLSNPEDILLCQIIEERAFQRDEKMGETYEQLLRQVIEKLKVENSRKSVQMGELLICELEKACMMSL